MHSCTHGGKRSRQGEGDPCFLPACRLAATRSLNATLQSRPSLAAYSLQQQAGCLPASLRACEPASRRAFEPATLEPATLRAGEQTASLPGCEPATLRTGQPACRPSSPPACEPASLRACQPTCLPANFPACVRACLPADFVVVVVVILKSKGHWSYLTAGG